MVVRKSEVRERICMATVDEQTLKLKTKCFAANTLRVPCEGNNLVLRLVIFPDEMRGK